MFITVDAFRLIPNLSSGQRYFERASSSGGEGVITCTVTGDHLEWFENVLIEARKDSSIKHIFVQAHVPIIQPVRKSDCSGQFLDNAKSSDFWKIMSKYEVDVYFAGEVHANTVTKDDASNLLQIVSRGNRINNFLTVIVHDEGFTVSSYNEIGTEWRYNGNYTKYGEVSVNKAGNTTTMASSGSLKIVDFQNYPLIQLNFDEKDTYPFHSRQIIGMKHDQFKEVLLGQNITIRNETSSTGMENYGVFGRKLTLNILNFKICHFVTHLKSLQSNMTLKLQISYLTQQTLLLGLVLVFFMKILELQYMVWVHC